MICKVDYQTSNKLFELHWLLLTSGLVPQLSKAKEIFKMLIATVKKNENKSLQKTTTGFWKNEIEMNLKKSCHV